MLGPDLYYDAALAAARVLQDAGRLSIVEDQGFEQGKNNRVVQVVRDGWPAVLKYYGDGFREHPVPAEERRRREMACLSHFAPSGVVPRVLDAAAPDVLVIEHFEGPSLAAWLLDRRDGRDCGALDPVAVGVGIAYGRLAAVPLATNGQSSVASMLRSDRPLREHIAVILERAEETCNTTQGFSATDAESIALIRDQLETLIVGCELVYKYDNNTTNVLLRPGEIPGLIDFEQCLPGTPAMMLGALFDCLHDVLPDRVSGGFTCVCRLPWPSFLSGMVREYPGVNGLAWSAVLAGACLNNWVRVNASGGDRARWAPRLRTRFQHYLSLRAREP